MRFGAARARRCGVGGEADAAVGADVVAAGGSFPTVEAVSAAYGPTSGSLALMSGSRPSSGDTNESLPAVAFALGPSLLLQRSPASHPELVVPQALRGDTNESLPAVAFALGPSLLLQRSPASHPELVVPQALRCGGCSYPREWNRSSVCNGTLSAGVCSLWLSGPEHLGI